MRRATPTALALILLSGCGGGGSGTRLTKEEYAAQADAICGKYNQKTKTFGNPTSLSELAKVADKTLAVLDHAIRDISKLEPPANEKALSDQWLTQVRNLKNDLREIRDKAKAGDGQGLEAVVPKASDHNAKSNALATRLGMSVCNKD
jgi:hypothetical protein